MKTNANVRKKKKPGMLGISYTLTPLNETVYYTYRVSSEKKRTKLFHLKSMEGEKNLIWGIQGEQEAIEEGP